jgi:Site-specific recombinase XerD
MTHQNFYNYYSGWIDLYKRGAVREVTLQKYLNTLAYIKRLAPNQSLESLNRQNYQQLLNDFALNHERQTVMDFHHQLKAAILDALDEGIIRTDPTRKVVIKGTIQRKHKTKFLHQHQMTALLGQLSLGDSLNTDYLVLLIAKTGLRISEALALTPTDFDFKHHHIKVSKTWDYKNTHGGFAPTKILHQYGTYL